MIIDFDRLLLSLIYLSRQVSDWHNNHRRKQKEGVYKPREFNQPSEEGEES